MLIGENKLSLTPFLKYDKKTLRCLITGSGGLTPGLFTAEAGFFVLYLLIYLIIVGKNIPVWIYIFIGLMIVFVIYSTLKKIKQQQEMIRSVFDTYGGVILTVLFIILFILESKLQLRKRVQSRWKRIFINFIVSMPSFVLLRLLFIPLMVWLAFKNKEWQFGLNYLYDAPAWLEGVVAFLLLDYFNYLWHVVLHKMPLMWRFHLVHHSDLDLDITTAFRFHFGEFIGSIFFRGAAVILIGVSPLVVLVYEIAFDASNQFQHSNLKLPFHFEKILNKIFVTPRMHGIHHSMKKRETDSNYSIIFSFWDRLHNSIKLNVPQDEIVTGVRVYPDEDELTIGKLLKLPFTKIRKWKEEGGENKEEKEKQGKLYK